MHAEKQGHTSPNHRTANKIREILSRNENRIIYNVFSAHIYNIQELFNEVAKTNRKIVIMGKTLQNIVNNALELKYLKFDKNRIGDLSNINDKDVIILVSNEREKTLANINRMINGYDKYIKIKETDTIVFGEPISDNIERSAVKAADAIAKIGANVIMFSPKDVLLHHASSEDLMLMINLMNPKYYFPVKGEYRFQVANANVATEVGIKPENILLKQNGEVVEFVDGKLVECFDKVKTEDILIDGNAINDIGEAVLKDREVLSENGIVIISTTLDKKTKQIISGPEVITRGFVYVKDSSELLDEIKKLCVNVIKSNINSSKYIEYNKLKTLLRESLGKYLYKETECKPMIITVFQEV